MNRGREFSNDEVAGRNASEPRRSLVIELEKPTLWSKGEGRWTCAVRTEVAHVDSRGSKDGMLRKTHCPVLETRSAGWGGHRPLCIMQRKCSGLDRESEGFIVPLAAQEQDKPGRGKEPCFVRATKERRSRGLPWC